MNMLCPYFWSWSRCFGLPRQDHSMCNLGTAKQWPSRFWCEILLGVALFASRDISLGPKRPTLAKWIRQDFLKASLSPEGDPTPGVFALEFQQSWRLLTWLRQVNWARLLLLGVGLIASVTQVWVLVLSLTCSPHRAAGTWRWMRCTSPSDPLSPRTRSKSCKLLAHFWAWLTSCSHAIKTHGHATFWARERLHHAVCSPKTFPRSPASKL